MGAIITAPSFSQVPSTSSVTLLRRNSDRQKTSGMRWADDGRARATSHCNGVPRRKKPSSDRTMSRKRHAAMARFPGASLHTTG